jgi:hypothetical protein
MAHPGLRRTACSRRATAGTSGFLTFLSFEQRQVVIAMSVRFLKLDWRRLGLFASAERIPDSVPSHIRNPPLNASALLPVGTAAEGARAPRGNT